MTHSFQNVDSALPVLAGLLRTEGAEVGSRLGERTQELLHQQIVLDMPWQREVLAPHRNVNIAAQIAETMWVLSGRSDVEWLSHYLPRAADFSDDGKVWRGAYGPRLRKWTFLEGDVDDAWWAEIDQIKHIVDVLNSDRGSRRAVVSIYDPSVDTQPGKDIPCNDFLSFISRDGWLDLSVFVRSNDLIWGWSGINAFEWSALQEIIAGILGIKVGRLVFNTTSLHVYDRHWEKARRIENSGKYAPTGYADSPGFDFNAIVNTPEHQPNHPVDALDEVIGRWFDIEARLRNGAFLSGEDTQIIDGFPEPMLQSWLWVIAWYWTGDEGYLRALEGTRLHAATSEVPKSILLQVDARRSPVEAAPVTHKRTFVEYVDNLHREKSAAYGDSWKKRGEQMSILANIARKIDRLESGKDTEDEVIADTAVDLLVYLIKYRIWLSDQHPEVARLPYFCNVEESDVRRVLGWLNGVTTLGPPKGDVVSNVRVLVSDFETLEQTVGLDPLREQPMNRVRTVDNLILNTFPLARQLWEKERAVLVEKWREANPNVDFQNPYRNIDA